MGIAMRTYAPADPSDVLDRLLEEPSLARGVVHHAVIPAREAVHRADARRGWIRASWRGSAGAASTRCTPTRRRRSRPSTPARTSSSSRRPPRASRCATPCPRSRPSPRTRRRGPCSCSRPRRSARTRSPSSARSRARRRHRHPSPRPTTATRRPRSGPRSGRPARSWSPTRTCSTRRSSPTTPSGSSCSSSCARSPNVHVLGPVRVILVPEQSVLEPPAVTRRDEP